MPDVPNCCCLKGSGPYWSNSILTLFLIFDIQAHCHSVLSARVPESQNLKMVGSTSMTKCKALTGLAVEGLMKYQSRQRTATSAVSVGNPQITSVAIVTSGTLNMITITS